MPVDVTIWWGRLALPSGMDGAAPALMLGESSDDTVVQTLVDVSTTKPSAAAPDLDGVGLVPFVLIASGGAAWAVAGAAPEAVAKAAGAIRLPEGVPISGYMRAGQKIAAIAAS